MTLHSPNQCLEKCIPTLKNFLSFKVVWPGHKYPNPTSTPFHKVLVAETDKRNKCKVKQSSHCDSQPQCRGI